MWSLAIVLLVSVATNPTVEVSTLNGTTVVGELLSLSPDQVTVATAEGEASVPSKQLLEILSKSPAKLTDENATVLIELVDGSLLSGVEFRTEDETATLGLGGDERIEFPAASIARVKFSSANEEFSTWPADIGKNAAADMLAVRKAEAVDFLEGVIGKVTDETIEFQIDGETIPVKRAKIDGLIYYRKAGKELAEPKCVVDDAHGWRLNAKDVSLVDDAQLEIVTIAGPKFRRPLQSISRLDFSLGKVVYLSSLEPEAFEWKPLVDFGTASPALSQFYALRRDQGREHSALNVGGKTYSRGLAIASRTAVTYRVPAGAKKFKAMAGIDDAVRHTGHVVLTISADGKQLFSQAIDGRSDPVPIDLDITGIRKLTFLVDYGDDLDTGDYLNLADARILK